MDYGVTGCLPHFQNECLDFRDWFLCNLYSILVAEHLLMCIGPVSVITASLGLAEAPPDFLHCKSIHVVTIVATNEA